ncbi:hypothetical protein LCGC14_2641800, partial [marine sediment metagenome]
MGMEFPIDQVTSGHCDGVGSRSRAGYGHGIGDSDTQPRCAGFSHALMIRATRSSASAFVIRPSARSLITSLISSCMFIPRVEPESEQLQR